MSTGDMICNYACVCACSRSKRKTASAINTKLGTHMTKPRQALTLRSRGQGYEVWYTGKGMHVDMTALVC